MRILVIGGTGNVGAEVVKELKKRKADIRLLVRNDSTPTPPEVEVAIGDLLDPVSVDKAMRGVDKLYLLNAVAPDELTQGLIAYDLAKKLGLKHVVYHSVFRVGTLQGCSTLCLEARNGKRIARVRRSIHDHSPELLHSERCKVEGRSHKGWNLPDASRRGGNLGS